MTEGVVDLFETVQVDNGDRDAGVGADGVDHGLLGALVEERPVGEFGEGVVLGQELVLLHLVAQAAAHRDGDDEEGHVQRAQAEEEVAVQGVEPGVDVEGDGRIGQVHLEHPDHVLGRARRERKIDLDRPGPDAAPCRCCRSSAG